MKKIYFFLILSILVIFSACTKTYEDYRVDIDITYSVIVDNQEWDIDTLYITEKVNVSQGDTSKLQLIKIDAVDRSYPYPSQLEAYVYLNPLISDSEISVDISSVGLIDEIVLNQIDLSYENILYRYAIDKTKVFPPTFTVFNFDNARNLITGTIEGALHDKASGKTKLIKVSFQNIKIQQ